MGSPATTVTHAYGIDIFRIMLCVGVVCYHYSPQGPFFGALAVIGFFVLSGFLTGVHFEVKDSLDVCRFYSGKIRRLLPMSVASLVLGILFVCYKQHSWNALTSINYADITLCDFIGQFNGALWYMRVEFILLACAPFFYYVSRRMGNFIVFFIGCMLVTSFLYSYAPTGVVNAGGLYFSPTVRVWEFVGGMLSAKVFVWVQKRVDRPLRMSKLVRAIAVICSMIFVIVWSLGLFVPQQEALNCWNFSFACDCCATFFYILFIPLLYCCNVPVASWSRAAISYLALLSFPIFLLHSCLYDYAPTIIGKITGIFCEPSDSCSLCVALFLTLLLSMLMQKIQSALFNKK